MAETALSSHENFADPSTQQRSASDPAASVWVNASAGSGKTTILTSRVTRLLLEGVKPQKILCLTFTKAAAAEMSLRVTGKLSLWAVCGEDELSDDLYKLQGRLATENEKIRARRLFAEMLACPGGMRIRTLHAFGQEVLRRFPIESGLPPHFSVIEENDARALQDDILTQILREAAQQPESAVAKSLGILIGKLGDSKFREAVQNILREKSRIAGTLAQHGNMDTLIARMRAALALEPDDTAHNLIRAAFSSPALQETELSDAFKILLEHSGKNPAKRATWFFAWREKDTEARIASFDEYRKCFLKEDGDFYADYIDKKTAGAYPDLDRLLRREAMRLQSLMERCEAAGTAEVTAAILTFGLALIDKYDARKNMQASLDYDDLVIKTLRLLQQPGIAPWVLHKLDDGIDHLLVDEAQDTSRAQWNIVATLAEEFFSGMTAQSHNRTLFVVGDEKQSIYSFQNADPAAFASMRQFFQNKIRAAEKTFAEIPLHVSFRSAPAVLRAVDAVFAEPAAAAGVSATLVQHFSFKHETLFGRVELWPLMAKPAHEKDTDAWALPIGYEAEQDPQAELAAYIASTIQGWLQRGERLPGHAETIRPGDIMILLRRRGRFADLMVRALKQLAIPVTGVDRMRLMEELPVMDLLALLQFTLLPDDDLNLACLLRGPFFKVSEDELMQVAAGRGTATLWNNLKIFAARNDAPQSLRHAHDYLAAWLGKADYSTPFALLMQILSEPCPATNVSGRHALWMRLGLDALDPIEELLNAAQNFSRNHPPSLQNFLHWLMASDNEIKREMDNGSVQGAGQVRIMTVHASKGLEAPIVFLPDTSNVPRTQDVVKFLWAETKGSTELPFYIASKPATGTLRRIWSDARGKQLEEYRRLLYVAMTRASHRLYIGGWELKKKEADGNSSWYNLIKSGLRASEAHSEHAKNMIVWEDPAPLMPNSPAAAPQPSSAVAPLPLWATQSMPAEKAAAPTIAPSTFMNAVSAAPDAAYARGRIIHRLLQYLPDIQAARREAAAKNFLIHPQHNLSAAAQADILREVLRLFAAPDIAPFFGEDSRAEVPLTGSVEGRMMAGQIDRLYMAGGEVWILDYKTNQLPPASPAAIPAAYRAQMEAYRAIMRAIYPDKTVRCFLLWTFKPVLMEVAR